MKINQYIEKNIKWLFPLPAVIFILFMMLFPIAYTIVLSFLEWNMSTGGIIKFIGLNNYISMLKEPRFYHAFYLTFYFTLSAVSIEIVLGLFTALILNKEFIGKNFTKFILLLPMVTTPVAIGLAWTLFYEPTIGLGNYALKLLGLPPSKWLASNITVIPSLVLVDIWEWTPMVTLIILAGLVGIPQEPYEAALVDGANRFQTFSHITLPLLTPTILIAVVLRSIDALKTFDIIYVMTTGGPGFASETLNIYAYNQGFGYYRFGAASSTLVALFLIVLVFSALVLKMRKPIEL